jgi:alanyl-tRNA synthetase
VHSVQLINGVNVLTAQFIDADIETLRNMGDHFRQIFPHKGIAVLSSVIDERPKIITVVTKDLVNRGINAGDLASYISRQLGGGGGGKPTLAQAGGKDPSKLHDALESVSAWVTENLNK